MKLTDDVRITVETGLNRYVYTGESKKWFMSRDVTVAWVKEIIRSCHGTTVNPYDLDSDQTVISVEHRKQDGTWDFEHSVVVQDNRPQWKNPEGGGEPKSFIVADLMNAMKEIERVSENQPDTLTFTETHVKDYRDDPAGFASDVLGVTLTETQKDIIRGLPSRSPFCSDPNTGKTTTPATEVLDGLLKGPFKRDVVIQNFVQEFRLGGYKTSEEMLVALVNHIMAKNYELQNEVIALESVGKKGPMQVLIFNYPDGNEHARQAQEANARQIKGYYAIVCPRNPTSNFPAVELAQAPSNLPGFKKTTEMTADHRVRIIYEEDKSSE